MLLNVRTVGAACLAGFWLSSACTIKGPEEYPGAGSSGSGGSAPVAGKSNGGGGKSSNPGTGGKAGRGNTSAGGEGGEGGAARECPGCASGFCLADGTCVDCLASNDQCDGFQYCTEANECEVGCKTDGSTCASGVCGDDRNCQKCISDDECLPGLLCSHGECAEPCSVDEQGASDDCSAELSCCSMRCSDLLTDSLHCGACGNACEAGQFCGLSACEGDAAAECASCFDSVLANLCSIGKVVVLLDSDKNDEEGNRTPGRAIGAALEAQCPIPIALSEAEQASVEALNLTTGRPVSGGGELLVVAGGPFFQSLEGYLEKQGIAPLYWYVAADYTAYRKSADDEEVVSLPIAGDHDSRDVFIIQFMRDPASGSLALNAQGLWLSGTVAAAYQITNVMLPNLSEFDQAWYAYEWTDMDGDKAPDADEIVEVASGI